MSRGRLDKGDVPGQKARWRARCAERAQTDEEYAARRRAQRRAEKYRAAVRAGRRPPPPEAEPTGVPWIDALCPPGGPRCLNCTLPVERGQLYCPTEVCNPHIRAKRRRARM